MRRIVLLLALAPLLFGAAPSDEAVLRGLLDQFLAGASRNDPAVHETFWADDLVYTSSAGKRMGKAEILRDVRSPSAKDEPPVTYTAEDVRIRLYGDTAVVAFRLVSAPQQYLNTGTFVKREGKWQAVAWQATKLALFSAPEAAESRLTVMPAGDLKWVDLDPGAPGVKVVDLWGDHAKGAFGALFKLPAGFAAPLHTHTQDMKVVIVSGTYIQAPDGKPGFRLGPGSYFLQPGGSYRHTTTCDKSSDCVFFVESQGPFDLKPVAPGGR